MELHRQLDESMITALRLLEAIDERDGVNVINAL